MRIFTKFIIIAALAFFAVCNYRIFTFNGGISDTLGDKDWTTQLTTALSVEKIEYYDKTIPSGDTKYMVYILAGGKGYLMSATENDLTALKVLGKFSGAYNPQKVFVVPFYVEVIVGFIILIIPFRKRKKQSS